MQNKIDKILNTALNAIHKYIASISVHKVYYSFIILISIFLLIVTISSSYLLRSSGPHKNIVMIFIPKNSTYTEALDILKSHGIIYYKESYIILSRLTGVDKKLKAGYYKFNKHAGPLEVFLTLKRGETLTTTLTVFEGDSLLDICGNLSQSEDISYEYCIKLSRDKAFLKSLNINAPSLEGYLFPETYIFPKGLPVEDIFASMVKEFNEHFNKKLVERAYKLGMTRREVLTMASMIAKEAAVDEERPIISAVFHNRLKSGMMLQSDPTAVYGIKQKGEKITSQDIRQYNEYNTYFIPGLPPGPIASAGIKSIKAALYPAKVDYLYFVAKRDGTHHFSTDYISHINGIQKYLTNNSKICK